MQLQELNYSTLVELLRYRAQHQPNQPAYIFLKDGENDSVGITYQQLDLRARAIAAQLQYMNINGRAILVYPYDAGLEFIAAFLGCLYAEVVAVPSHPPRNRHACYALQARLASSQASVVLTKKNLLARLKLQLLVEPELKSNDLLLWLATDNIPNTQASDWTEPKISNDTLAFLQYTSGSTGIPLVD